MGLFNRLRSSSSATAAPSGTGAGGWEPVPPPPMPALTASSSRLSVTHQPASATASTSTSTSKPFWKRKAKDKGKEKHVPGFSYESTAPAPAPAPTVPAGPSQTQTRSFVVQQLAPAPATATAPHTWGRAEGYGYGYDAGHQDRFPVYPGGHDGGRAPRGILKGRGMLGRLDFEAPAADESASSTDDDHAVPLAQSQQQQRRQHGPDAIPRRHFEQNEQPSSAAPRMSQEEQERMEHLVSPEKKAEAVTPKARRRMSRSEEPVSPTPRKSSLPPQELGTPTASTKATSSDGHQQPSPSQQQQQRRPSASRRSSFIPLGNPFARSTTRLSLDSQPVVDDGSFQLRGFRHVSGASEADFAWEAYNSHPHSHSQQSAKPAVESPTAAVPAPLVASPISRPASTAPPSRPISRATSLASMDDHIASTAKVSAAAFRKGIRRQSQAELDVGANEDEDENDDVPLGLLRPGMGQRDTSTSALSLSSVREATTAPRTPGSASASGRKTPPPGPRQAAASLPATPARVAATAKPIDIPRPQLQPTRSRTTPLISPEEIHPMFPSPTGSPVISPSRVLSNGDEGYFPPVASASSAAAQQPPVESPVLDPKSLDYPIEAFSTSPRSIKTSPPPALAPPVEITPAPAPKAKLSISVPEPKPPLAHIDEIDSDMVIRSMAMYADAPAIADGDADAEEPPTPRMAMHQQSHSTLFGTDASSDTTSTIRSPLSERLGNLVGPRPMSSKPSLPKLNTLKLDEAAAGERGMRSPAASDSTVSPTVSTIRGHQPPASSISRGTVVSPVPSEPESSSSEDDDEDEAEAPPKRPAGPPRSSFANAPRPRIPPANRPVSASVSQTKKGTSSDDESTDNDDDDKPLARIRSKASRSTLAVNETVARPATLHNPTTTTNMAAPVPAPNIHARRASVPAVVMASPLVQPKTIPAAGTSPTKPIWNASPASSQSGLTGDSSAAQPVTPSENDMSEGSASAFKPASATGGQENKRASVSWATAAATAGQQNRQCRDSHHSTATAPPSSLPHQHHAQAPPVPPLPSGMDPLMRQRMKEMWQAQYMAAASRAFEDEWERQSTTSGATGPAPSVVGSTHSGYPGYPAQYPQYPMPPPPPPPVLGYGWPQQQQQQYGLPSWGMPPPQSQPSMYSYGTGAQSVYGAEFGPPQPMPMPMSPYGMGMGMGGLPGSYSTTNLAHYPSSPSAAQQRPGLLSSRSSSYFPQQQSHGNGNGRQREVDLDYTPPKGLIQSVPNSPRGGAGAGAANRRSALGTSVISANDRSSSTGPPPTSWRRSSAMPLLNWDEEEAAAEARTPKQQRRQSRHLVN